MSLAVVRCPECLGASRVEAEAVGEMVACPRCQVPFVAVEEVVPTVQPTYRPQPAVPARRGPRREGPPEPELAPPPADEPTIPDPEHDPHLPPVAGLPVSVLVGLSLLPLAIPLLWWAAPVVTGQQSALSLAVPISLAFAASALGLGVVYTIDWTAATRVKGVLMLVGLAYLSAAGLFFLKKDLIDQVRAWGAKKAAWQYANLDDGRFQVLLPGPPEKAEDQPLLPVVRMTAARRAAYQADEDEPRYDYLAAYGKVGRGVKADDDWFDAVGQALAQGRGELIAKQAVAIRAHPGREWQFKKDDTSYFVRVYVIEGRVYYLSAEGPRLDAGDELVSRFFNSFDPNPKE